MQVCSVKSPDLIVRGRSPGHYNKGSTKIQQTAYLSSSDDRSSLDYSSLSDGSSPPGADSPLHGSPHSLSTGTPIGKRKREQEHWSCY